MANSDVKVREIRLLESYSQAYDNFMQATIHMTYRFRTLFAQKDDEARDLERKIKNHLNIARVPCSTLRYLGLLISLRVTCAQTGSA